MADEKLQIDITAKDDASKVIDPLVKKVDQLEKADPNVKVGADTHSAVNDVDTFAKKLEKLSDSDQVVLLALRAGAAQSELADIATKLATVDASDPTVDVQIERYQQVSSDLDDLKTKITAIGDTPLDIGGGDGGKNIEQAKTKLHELGDEADRTKDTVHSMAGNAIGDFAQTATGIGPLGEALGQLTELASGGESSLKQLAAAGLGLGAISAGIAVLNIVMGKFAEASKRAAEIKAFNDKQVKDYTDSILAAITALDKLNGVDIGDPIPAGVNKNMQDLSANTIELVTAWEKAGKIEAFDPVAGKITDMTHALAAAGITADQWAAAVINGGVAINALGVTANDAGVSVDKAREIMQTAAEESKKYDTAQGDAADRTKVFAQAVADTTPTLAGLAAGLGDNDGSLTKLAASTRKASADFKGLNDQLRTAASGTNALDLAYQGLSGTVDQDQSLINLKNQIADVQTAWQNAQAAQADADKATAKHSKDAADKQAAAAQATRDYQTAVNSLKTDIINLGQAAGENPVDVKADIDKIDAKDLAGVEADAEAYFRAHPIDAATRLKLISTIVAGVGQPVSTSQSHAVAPSVVNNNFLARPVAARETARLSARHARINGR